MSLATLPNLRNLLAALLTLLALLFAANVTSRMGIALYTEQFLALVLGLCLALCFITTAEKFENGRSHFKTLYLFLAALGLSTALFVAVDYRNLLVRSYSLSWDVIVVGGILFLLILEGLRRSVGLVLVLVVLTIAGYGLIGHLVEGPLQTREVSVDRLISYFAVDANGILGLTLNVAATVVIAFVFFGQLLLKSGGADFFNDIALATMGRRRGGAAKISIVASGLFGSISGVVVSNIVATGVVTIKLMIDAGLRRHQAAAIEAVASTGGQIVPPVMGAVAFLMADFLQRPYYEIVVAAIIPALFYYIALFVQVDIGAAKDRIAAVDENLIPETKTVLKSGWIFILPFAAVVWAIFFALQRPEVAALWGSASALVVGAVFGYGGKRMSVSAVLDAFVETGRAIVDIILIAAAAGLIIGTLNVTGLGFGLTFTLVSLGKGSLLVLLIVAAGVCLILGMGMPTVGVYLLLAVLVAPSLIESGVDPIAAHLFIFYLGMMSMVTPPVAIGAFFAAAIAKSKPMETALVSMRYGWTAYIIPFYFVLSPTLILKGDWITIAVDVVTAGIGIYLISAGAIGWVRKPLNALSRILLIISGLCLMTPLAFEYALLMNIIGAAISAGIIFLWPVLCNVRARRIF